ncbi:response regulator [Lihuaxuella thermophila]|uniref:Two-component system, NarL family, response regulator LiaR n=1 Tax=Lihuaxuella thermophila TaxID=1173111 RepID=A0A1H8GRD6_9BACL|nr:response regulator transcription factor [Lihuaxuella thermophila]SEN46057.1 two-component system, NarL family, response regulator LiaR [Lihuaxuella thermophila]
MIRVLIVDDHSMIRLGLAAYLEQEPEIEIVGEAANGREAVELSQQLTPDVILMDLVMDGVDGIAATREIVNKNHRIKIIVLTSFQDEEKVHQAIEAGAFSYLLKTSEPDRIVAAIRAAVKGQSILEESITGKVLSGLRRSKEPKPHHHLTPREMEVLKQIAKGKNNQQIADELYITVKTVKAHITQILLILGVADRTQAAIYAHRNRLVD